MGLDVVASISFFSEGSSLVGALQSLLLSGNNLGPFGDSVAVMMTYPAFGDPSMFMSSDPDSCMVRLFLFPTVFPMFWDWQ